MTPSHLLARLPNLAPVLAACLLAAALLIPAAPTPARAAESPAPAPAATAPEASAQKQRPGSMAFSSGPRLRVKGGWISDSEVHGSGSEVSVTGWEVEAAWKGFRLSYERVSYSWDKPGLLPFNSGNGDPWDDLSVVRLGYTKRGHLTGKWLYLAGASVSTAFEEEFGGSIGARLFAGGIYMLSPRTQLMVGAMTTWHTVRFLALPMVGVVWNRDTPQGLSLAVGYPQTFISYRFNPQWALVCRVVEFDQDVFLLADDSPVEPEGYLERRDMDAGIAVQWTPVKDVSVVAGGRYYFRREMTVYDSDGDNDRSYDLDPSWGGYLHLRWDF